MSKYEEQSVKVCTKCNRQLSVDHFYLHVRHNRLDKNGEPIKYYTSMCKECFNYQRNLRRLKERYSITPKELDLLPKECEVCGSTTDLCIDHRHSDGKVRGTLCKWCNFALGLLKDNPENIENLLKYINKSL